MKFEPVTIKDIAKALGLSASTISRALRDSYEISADTKEMVMQYARQNNYHPNPIAQSLKKRKSRSIGVIVPEIANVFFSQVINAIESVAHCCEYNVVITQSMEKYANEVDNVSFLASRSVDGCLVSVAAETADFSHFTSLQEKGFPVVFFDRIPENCNTHTVAVNNFQGAYDATLHLLKNGNRKIAVLACDANLSITKQRLAGYEKALRDYDLLPDEALIKYCSHDGTVYTEIECAMNRMFRLEDKPDAVFALTDKLTINCLKYCRANHILIPDELCLTGFNNLDFTELFSPALSVVRQPTFEIGKMATDLLIKMIEAKRPVTEFENRLLPTEFIARASSIREEIFV